MSKINISTNNINMNINETKREKRFTKEFKFYKSHKKYNLIKKLYLNDKIKTISSANKFFEKIQYKNDGNPYKYSLKYIDDLDELDGVKKIKKEDNVLIKRVLIIDSKKINEEKYSEETHKIQFNYVMIDTRKLLKKKKFEYIISQTVKFYDENNKLIDKKLDWYDPQFINVLNPECKDFQTRPNYKYVNGKKEFKIKYPEKDFKNRHFIHENLNYGDLKSIYFNMTDNDLNYPWIPYLFINFFYPKGKVEIITTTYKRIKPLASIKDKEMQTYMKDVQNACLFNGILKFFEQKKDKDRNAKASYNYLCKQEVQEEYFKPVKEEDLKDKDSNVNKILQKCKASLTIKDLVKGTINDKYYNTPYAKWNIEFLNTMYNHLDLLNHTYDNIIEVDKEEYKNILNTSEYYVEKFNNLITLDGIYKIKDDDFQIKYKAWKEKNNYDSLFIVEGSDEHNLIRSYDYGLHRFFDENLPVKNNLYKEIDIKKAYYNYSNKDFNKNYCGVPSGNFINIKCENFSIDDFNELTNNNLIGYYQVEIKKINEELKEKYNYYGIEENKIYTFTTPMINILKDNVQFYFYNASYSPSVHIPFTEDLMENTDEIEGKKRLAYYCKIFGLMLKSNDDISIKVRPLKNDYDYYNLLDDDNYKMYDMDGVIHIKFKNHVKKSKIHIGYYLHSYTRCLILEELLKMDIDKVFGVKLDSIVIKKDYDYIYDKNIFDDKKAKIQSMFKRDPHETNGYYLYKYIETDEYIVDFKPSFLPNNIVKNKVVFLGGKGGSGKTHSILKNIDNKYLCYTTNAWNLIQGKKNENKNILGYSLPNLTGKCDKFKTEKIKNNNIKFIFIDEATLIDITTIEQIINDYKNCFIFIAGDIDYNGNFYQCSLPKLKLYNPSLYNYQYIEYKKTYRFNEELNNKLNKLREYMKTDKEKINYKLHNYVKENFKECFYDIKDIKFNDDDIGISELKENQEITEYFINKGTKPQYFIKETKKEKGQLKGQLLLEIPKHDNYEMKLFKSIHSFQGLDLNENNNIIIYINDNFDYNLYYTALSRARRLDQIKIIKLYKFF